ncbi:Uma2 family endonuclease [Streptomyces sp. NPDC056452]|uniref:Uma2 family endonuclease n=1 Tax=Streptomyces sp. NPDC056452 TaxID=3345821 RepID=UPI003693BD5D
MLRSAGWRTAYRTKWGGPPYDDGLDTSRSRRPGLPGGPEDYAIPDLAVVDADDDEHLIENNCYDPAVFRLVLEVTSSNYKNDLRDKVAVYAEADIPVHVIVDRKHSRVHVLTEPTGGEYNSHEVYAPGRAAALPDSIGAKVTLDVAELVAAGRPRA